MATKINISPRGTHVAAGVYTQEIDLTSTVKSLGVTTLGLAGETLYGPAFQPIWITNYNEFKNYFGGLDPTLYKGSQFPRYELPYIAKSYLSESNQLFVTRVLGLTGYEHQGAWVLKSTGSTNVTIYGVIRPKYTTISSGTTNQVVINPVTNVTISALNKVASGFTLTVTKSDASTVDYNLSLIPSNENYITKVLGRNMDSKLADVYVEELYDSTVKDLNPTDEITISTKINDFNNYKTEYRSAMTPWFVSDVKGNVVSRLFRFFTISDGDSANTLFKISIANVDTLNLTFDVILRAFYDTDANPVVIETFSKCNMDPTSPNFIGYKIGTVDNSYEPKSKFIIVELEDDDTNYYSLPVGFEGLPIRDYSIAGISGSTPNIAYNTVYNEDIRERRQYFGISDLSQFNGIDSDFLSFKGLNSNGSELTLRTHGFHLNPNASGITGSVVFDTPTVNCIGDKIKGKFTSAFYGGFDGWDISRSQRTNGDSFRFNKFNANIIEGDVIKVITDEDINTTAINNSDYYAFLKAYRTFSDPESIDINVFATPGIDLENNGDLVQEVVDMIEQERGDSVYIITTPDKPSGSNDSEEVMYLASDVASIVDNSDVDSSYSATYYPWVKYKDSENNRYIYLPPTKDVVRTLAFTDNTSYPWFSPAGVIRGKVDCIRAKKSIKKAQEDTLVNGRINPIKTFSSEGVLIFGQKTLQKADTVRNRLNVRRLLIRLKKLVTAASLELVFSQNDSTTAAKFRSLVNPILNNIKNSRGIYDYKIEIDESPEAREALTLPVKIFVKPIRALEYIEISFVATPESVNFNEN